MLALLLSGLAAVAMVGGLAYVGINKKVDLIRRQQVADHFYKYLSAYLTQYGGWQAANAAEPFERFMHRTQAAERLDVAMQQNGAQAASSDAPRAADGEPGPAPGGRLSPPDDGGPGMPPQPDGRPRFRPDFDGPGGRPRPMPGEEGGPPPPPPGAGPADAGGREPGGQRPGERPPPPPGPRPGNEPPFHFIVADQDYKVLLGAGVYRPGEALPAAARKDARPVMVAGQVAAYISPEGVFTPSKEELQYLAAMREALLAGVTGAAVLALVLGVLLSKRLSRTLSSLTDAVRAMHGGSLLQRVPVHGKDEVAALANAFNAMSEQLARSHKELSASHQTILEQADQLRELSVRDALTKLYNRRHFDEQATTLFNQAVRHKRPLSLVIGDIDFFKRINDQYSHATGDAVLRQVGEILRGHMRLSDLVARYGGEEFVIALPETALPQAAALCDKLRHLIEGFPWHEVQPGLKVTMSMGVYADLAAGTAEAMLQQADALLYRAKESGRNQVCFA
ncbi:GGDEF domain-containing protein [Rugamonas fusca]|uniref:GGDEF domain-containing protein n=1 Tax=Rugamonas fusca TaxID=2758568 RepID=UPI001E596945|nr:diguanylate cyclase [Rugamonas fusca]